MKIFTTLKFFTALFLITFSVFSFSASMDKENSQSKSYSDSHGSEVVFPQGDVSFVDEVVSYQAGDPAPLKAKHRNPSNALGVPDYQHNTGEGYLSLGCGGVLVVKFNDNALTDIQGPDLHVFEVGTAIEPTMLEISSDNKHWIMIGDISGGRADIDIAKYTKKFDSFRYLKLTDLKQHCGRGSPGSDIDAIGAIGTSLRITLDSGVAFEFNMAVLNAESIIKLNEIIVQIESYPGLRITVAGHTDNKGSDEYNMQLSQQRANAVSYYLSSHFPRQVKLDIKAIGYGELHPVASNETEAGRQLNRHVEIIVTPLENVN